MSSCTGVNRLTRLPPETLQNVASFLAIDDLIRLCRVSCVRNGTIDAIARRFREDAGLLCFASETGRYELVASLLSCAADPNMEWTPAENSSLREHPACGGALCSEKMLAVYTSTDRHGHDVEYVGDNTSQQRLPYCSDRWGDTDPFLPSLPDLDLEKINVPRQHSAYPSWLPLHVAARNGDIDIVELLLQHGARPDIYAWGVCRCRLVALDNRSGFGKGNAPCRANDQLPVTPLHVALCCRQTAVAKLLFDRGSDPSPEPPRRRKRGPVQVPAAPRWREEAPHTAAATGSVEFFSYLYGKDPEIVDRKDAMGLTPLFHAYANGQHAMVRWLLEERHADPNVLLGRGLPLVYMACLDGDFRFAEDLVVHGAEAVEPLWGAPPVDAEGESIWGATLLELCAALHHIKNCDPGENDNDEQYTRRLARQKAYGKQFDQTRLEFMRHLLSRGAHISNRLLFTAAAQRSVPMLELLLKSGAEITNDPALLYEVIDSSRITFHATCVPDPLPALRWLSANGVALDRNFERTAACLSAYISNMSGPWKLTVLQWLLDQAAVPGGVLRTAANCIRLLQAAQRSRNLLSIQSEDFRSLLLATIE